MIEFEQVGFSYDGVTNALEEVTFSIPEGQFVCILGGNGSGKSTLARHINALLRPDAGKVRVRGCDTRDEEHLYLIRSSAGMVFQNPDDQLVASLVENEVAFGPENLGLPPQDIRHRVSESLERVGMQGFERHETATLSGGQKQRLAIAGALAMDPCILVLDESSAMLDPRGRRGLMKICRALHEQRMTIVMITHFMEEAALADRVIVLDEGRIARDGTPEDVLTNVDELKHLNLDVPFSCALSLRLQERGVPVRTHITEEGLEDELCRLLSKA